MSGKNVNSFLLMIMSVLVVISGIFCLANGVATALGHAFFGGYDIAIVSQKLVENMTDRFSLGGAATFLGICLAVIGAFQLWAGIAGIMASQNTPRRYRSVIVLGVMGAILSVIAILSLIVFKLSFTTIIVVILLGILPWLYLFAATRAGRRR